MQFTTTKPQVLTSNELEHMAPSVFAAGAAPTTSRRYAFVSTAEVISVLGRQGFHPVAAQEKRVRKAERSGFQAHVIRFRRTNDTQPLMVGDSIFEIVLRTAHDGTSAFDFSAGLFRLLCLNGLVAPSGQFGGFSVKHVGYAARDVVHGIESMLDDLPALAASVHAMQEVSLTEPEQTLFAESAGRLRWGAEVPVTSEQLLRPKRREDIGQSVWTTFNVVQEHLLRGGDRGRSANGRRAYTRAVQGVDSGTRLNRELWALAEAMTKLKRGESIGVESQG
ncbi:MAG: DUF932 domain-containing protein [Deltaproteobacteria bacterium]|nr:DUF932 domain-containing protein [Deltaproteobacteria bacterium]